MNNHSGRQLNKHKEYFLALILPLFFSVPSLLWIALDKSPFAGDASQYATKSVYLFPNLIRFPGKWLELLFFGDVLEGKPPGIVWVGQFFIPVGHLVGSIDKGLLSSVLLTNFVSLLLLFTLLWKISNNNLASTILGCLLFASAPLFIKMSTVFYVEPLQTLSTVWFLAILGFTPSWNRARVIVHLFGASTLAMIVKVSSPLYCVVPALASLWLISRPNTDQPFWDSKDKQTLATLGFATPVSLAGIYWYMSHYKEAIQHAILSASNPVFGKEDTFINNISYWLTEIESLFFLSTFSLIVFFLCILFVVYIFLFAANKADRQFKLFTLVSAIQIIVVLLVFATVSSNRITRFLLPLLPYFCVFISLAFAKLDKPLLTGLTILIITCQYFILQAQILGIVDYPPKVAKELRSLELRSLNRSQANQMLITAIVMNTCTKKDNKVINVLAIDLRLKGDWLAPQPANYIVAKELTTQEFEPRCQYQYIGNSIFGEPAEDAWQHIQSWDVKYVIIADPRIYPPKAKVINQTLNAKNVFLILNYLETSGYFSQGKIIEEDPGILIFKRSRSEKP